MAIDVLLRSEKGSVLTHAEMDNNLSLLESQSNASRIETVKTSSALHAINTKRAVLVDAAAQNITVQLPDPTVENDKIIIIKRIDGSANTVTVAPNSTETIDGQTSITLDTQWAVIRLISDGSDWYLV